MSILYGVHFYDEVLAMENLGQGDIHYLFILNENVEIQFLHHKICSFKRRTSVDFSSVKTVRPPPLSFQDNFLTTKRKPVSVSGQDIYF